MPKVLRRDGGEGAGKTSRHDPLEKQMHDAAKRSLGVLIGLKRS